MRKSFLTKEYSLEPVSGTLNMTEQRSFFASKILEIEDVMRVDENDIFWNESDDNTQGITLDNQNKTLAVSNLKNDNHSIRIFPNQSNQEKRQFTRWEFKINIREIITQYLFAKLKSNRTFETISNENTLNNSINSAIYRYIRDNVFPRIKFSNIILYVKYYRVAQEQDNGVIALQNDNKFRKAIIIPTPLSGETTTEFDRRSESFKESLRVENYELTVDTNQNVATLLYKQIESSTNFKFDYYFDVIYEKA